MSGLTNRAKARRAKEERVVEAAIQWLTWKRGELEGFPPEGFGPDGRFGLADLEEATAALVGPPKPEPLSQSTSTSRTLTLTTVRTVREP